MVNPPGECVERQEDRYGHALIWLEKLAVPAYLLVWAIVLTARFLGWGGWEIGAWIVLVSGLVLYILLYTAFLETFPMLMAILIGTVPFAMLRLPYGWIAVLLYQALGIYISLNPRRPPF